jgi:hypothetical protein
MWFLLSALEAQAHSAIRRCASDLAHLLNGGMTLCACASVIIIFATDPVIFPAKAPG